MKVSELKNKINSLDPGLKENIVLLILFLLIFEFLFLLAFFSESSFGGADSFNHYFISRYSFNHPHLFVHHWGKPVFTLLSAPFSQLGFTGCKTFNIIVSLATALFSYLIVKKLNMKYSAWTILLVIFTPVFLTCSFSCLTEPLFAFFIILSVFLIFQKKYIASSVLISFILLIRFEGFILLPLFFIAYVFLKKYKAIPFLLTGFVLYSLIGSIYYKDFFWLITENPYTGAASIYGKGELFHYINKYDEITGTPLAVMFLLGLIYFIIKIIKDRKKIEKIWLTALFLLLGSCFTYLAAHSWVWWKGSGSSLGLVRVMTGITPIVAITTIGSINLLDIILKLNKKTGILINSALSILVISVTLSQYDLPVYFDREERTINKASEWIRSSEYKDKPVMFFNPYVCYSLEIDPYDSTTSISGYYHNNVNPMDLLPVEGIIVWDAHHGPNEAYMPLENLLKNKNTKLVKRISPDIPFYTLNEHDYEIFIFQKVGKSIQVTSKTDSRYINFDDDIQNFDPQYITNNISLSGANSYYIDSVNNSSPEIIIRSSETTPGALSYIFARAYIYPDSDISDHRVYLIISTFNNDILYKYKNKKLEWQQIKPGQWGELTLEYLIPEKKSDRDYTKIHIMHKGGGVYIDDFFVEVHEFNEKESKKYENEYFEKQIKFYENKIRQDKKWYKQIVKKAGEKGLDVDSMIRLDAIYMIKQDEKTGIEKLKAESQTFEDRIKYYEEKIRQDTVWLKSIEKKAIYKNISLDEMIRIDAKYMTEKEKK